jgi:hypothetical protein
VAWTVACRLPYVVDDKLYVHSATVKQALKINLRSLDLRGAY